MSESTIDKARSLLDAGKADVADGLLSKELETNPRSAPLLLTRAQVRMRNRNVEGALKDAQDAYKYGDAEQRTDAQLRKAMCYFKLKKFGLAKGLVPLFAGVKDAKAADIWKTMIMARPEESEQESPAEATPEVSESPAPVRKDWYQSSQSITISVFHKKTPKDATVDIEPRFVHIVASDGFDFRLDLFGEIDPEKSHYEITPNKIELVLAKRATTSWPKLEYDASAPTTSETITPPKPSPSTKDEGLPTFSKWDKLKISDSDDESGDEGNGSDPNEFFQKLYQGASPDTQRAMMKSFIESNGTALSTNWDEVGKGPVKTYPPQGTEPKKF